MEVEVVGLLITILIRRKAEGLLLVTDQGFMLDRCKVSKDFKILSNEENYRSNCYLGNFCHLLPLILLHLFLLCRLTRVWLVEFYQQ